MSRSYFYKPKNKPAGGSGEDDSDAYVKLITTVPKELAEALKAQAKKLEISPARLMAYAIDNELDLDQPFTYSTEIETPYIYGEFYQESLKVFNYMKKRGSGAGRDTLLLARREIGLTTKREVLGGVRELLKRYQLVEYKPGRNTVSHYPESYRFLKIRDTVKFPITDQELEQMKREPGYE